MGNKMEKTIGTRITLTTWTFGEEIGDRVATIDVRRDV